MERMDLIGEEARVEAGRAVRRQLQKSQREKGCSTGGGGKCPDPGNRESQLVFPDYITILTR